jgi:hypothetical protein
MAAVDPFTQVYQAIWGALTSWSGFTALVAAGNRNDLSAAAFEAIKPEAQAGDLPEVTLLQSAFTLKPQGASSLVAEATQIYPLVTASDSLRVLDVNAVKYQALIAMAKADPALGLSFVRAYRLREGEDRTDVRLLNATAARGTDRMISIVRFEVEMYFARGDLAAM